MSGTTRLAGADLEGAISAPEAAGTFNPDFLFKVPPFERLRDKVAIVGFTDHRQMAMELDDSFEVWGLNELYRYMPIPKFHRWFEIHGREYLCADDEGKKHIEDLKSVLGPIPIYMQRHHEDIPGSVRFPIQELIEHFGGERAIGANYFTNCPAEMIAFAIALGYREIHVYGVDMAQDSEYGTQRPCCEYWLGRALGMGIKVYVPDMSDLLKTVGTYGYEDAGSVLSRKIQSRIKWLHAMDNERLAQIRGMEANYNAQRTELVQRVHRYEGAIEELTAQRRPKRNGDRLTALEAERKSTEDSINALDHEYRQKSQALIADRNQIVGGIHDCEYWLRAWSMKASTPDGGNIPSAATRAADARTGVQAPSGDNQEPAAAQKQRGRKLAAVKD